ncbi:MAG: putative Zn-dependent protease, involved in pqq synthesis (ppqF) [Bacteroidetes bacterium]|nr:putative Zn-dependent protease, involved in pqq synthesis (ppqF) [Bacteroidota bacterium]
MMKLSALSAVLCLALAVQAGTPASYIEGTVYRHHFENGLTVLTMERHVAPLIYHQLTYRVGSRNERLGITGISHVVEHMMFKGTPKYGKGEASKTITNNAGVFNAFTANDMTSYFEYMPVNKIALAMEIESDRMQNCMFDPKEFTSEIEVIKQERRMRSESSPQGIMHETMNAVAYQSHPNRDPIIGWPADLDRMTREDAFTYYRTYYTPNNAFLVLVGDFATDSILAMVRRYYGKIPRGPAVPDVWGVDQPQRARKTFTITHNDVSTPSFRMAFHVPTYADTDAATLRLAGMILCERSRDARLHKRLIEKGKLATGAAGGMGMTKDPGLFSISVSVVPDSSVERAEAMVWEEIERMQREPVPERELQKAKNRYRFTQVTEYVKNPDIGSRISRYEAFFGWDFFPEFDRRVKAVTTGQIQAAMQKYLQRHQVTVGYLQPKEGKKKAARQPAGEDETKPEEPQPESGWNEVWNFLNPPPPMVLGVPEDRKVTGRKEGQSAVGTEINTGQSLSITTPGGSQNQKAQGAGRARPADPPTSQHDTRIESAKTTDPLPVRKAGDILRPKPIAPQVHRMSLDNGISLYVIENHLAPAVFIGGFFETGNMPEANLGGKPGIASLLADVMNRGTEAQEYEVLSERMAFLPFTFGVSGSARSFSFQGYSLVEDAQEMMQVGFEMLTRPGLRDKDIESLRRRHIISARDRFNKTGMIAFYHMFNRIFREHPYSQTNSTEASLRSITRDDLEQLHKRYFRPDRVTLVVMGDMTPDAMRVLVNKQFGSWKTEGAPPPVNVVPPVLPLTGRELTAFPEKDYTECTINIGFSPRNDVSADEQEAIGVLNTILAASALTSRIGVELRDKQGLIYGIKSEVWSPSGTIGYWKMNTKTGPQNVERVITGIFKEIRKLFAEGLKPEEIEASRNRHLGLLPMIIETPDDVATQVFTMLREKQPLDHFDKKAERLLAISADELMRIADKYLTPENFVIVVDGPVEQSTLDRIKDTL